jgi:hypothetical protein
MGTDTKVAAAINLLRKQGYDVRKAKKKKSISNLYFRLSFLFGMYSKFVKKPITQRKITMAVAKSKLLDEVLDEFITGTKRKAFDDTADKKWTTQTVIQDITTNGQFKRYKLVERYIRRFWNSETTRIIFDDTYSIQDYINKNKK